MKLNEFINYAKNICTRVCLLSWYPKRYPGRKTIFLPHHHYPLWENVAAPIKLAIGQSKTQHKKIVMSIAFEANKALFIFSSWLLQSYGKYC
jgi:hypothetical protein